MNKIVIMSIFAILLGATAFAQDTPIQEQASICKQISAGDQKRIIDNSNIPCVGGAANGDGSVTFKYKGSETIWTMVGPFVNGLPSGFFVIKNTNGWFEEVTYANGVMNGPRKYFSPKSGANFDGEMRNGHTFLGYSVTEIANGIGTIQVTSNGSVNGQCRTNHDNLEWGCDAARWSYVEKRLRERQSRAMPTEFVQTYVRPWQLPLFDTYNDSRRDTAGAITASNAVVANAQVNSDQSFTYDGTTVQGRAANFDILGVKLNMLVSAADQVLAREGYSCKTSVNGFILNFSERVQLGRRARDATISAPIASQPVAKSCTKINSSPIGIGYIATPSGMRVSSVSMTFDSDNTEYVPLKERVQKKYGVPDVPHFWCDLEKNRSWCSNSSVFLRFGDSNSKYYLNLQMPVSYKRDIDLLVAARVDVLSPKNGGGEF